MAYRAAVGYTAQTAVNKWSRWVGGGEGRWGGYIGLSCLFPTSCACLPGRAHGKVWGTVPSRNFRGLTVIGGARPGISRRQVEAGGRGCPHGAPGPTVPCNRCNSCTPRPPAHDGCATRERGFSDDAMDVACTTRAHRQMAGRAATEKVPPDLKVTLGLPQGHIPSRWAFGWYPVICRGLLRRS